MYMCSLCSFLTTRLAHGSIGPFSRVQAYPMIQRQNMSCGAVAQLGARVNGIHEVAGSIPASSTNIFSLVIHIWSATSLTDLLLSDQVIVSLPRVVSR